MAKHVPNRSDVQCRERYMNVLDPSLKAAAWDSGALLPPMLPANYTRPCTFLGLPMLHVGRSEAIREYYRSA